MICSAGFDHEMFGHAIKEKAPRKTVAAKQNFANLEFFFHCKTTVISITGKQPA
ncbi:MAG: hypothetical protein L3J01_05325 [Thiomicrorhabdus sp.]|nr:hypothetical protein [Thiomicrorhabdus sp.]